MDGRWGKQAKEALTKFAHLTKASLAVDEPTPEALQALIEQKKPICSPTREGDQRGRRDDVLRSRY
jgi:hypothetical protein